VGTRIVEYLLGLIFGLVAIHWYVRTKDKKMGIRNPDPDSREFAGSTLANKVKGWSKSGTLVTFDSTNKISAQAVFDAPWSYTVQFSIVPRAFTGDPPIIECEADIEWSVAGNTVTRRITVVNGASISGVGEAVRVVCSDHTETGPVDLPYDVFISIAPGTRSGNAEMPAILVPRILLSPVSLAPGASFDYPIPENVGAYSVMVTVCTTKVGVAAAPPIPDCATQVQHRPVGAPLKQYDPRGYDWVPIAPGASFIRVLNTNAAGEADQLFNVTFGIDG